MLTQKQQQVYEFIRDYLSEYAYAPTESEIATHIGIKSTGVVHRYVTALVEAGVLEVIPNRRRNIRLIENYADQEAANRLPLLGKIAAGSPLEAVTDQESLDLNHMILGPKRFALRVSGDSMIGDNICDGDFVICEAAQVARDHDIVVALIDQQEVTLKRFKRAVGNQVQLIPSNPTLSPMHYNVERVQIQGIYVGLLRLERRAK